MTWNQTDRLTAHLCEALASFQTCLVLTQPFSPVVRHPLDQRHGALNRKHDTWTERTWTTRRVEPLSVSACVVIFPPIDTVSLTSLTKYVSNMSVQHIIQLGDTQRDVRYSLIILLSHQVTSCHQHHLHCNKLERDDRENAAHHTLHCSPYMCTFYIFAS